MSHLADETDGGSADANGPAEMDAAARRREADRLDDIARAIAAPLALDAVLQRIVAATLDMAAADYAVVWLLDEAGTAGVASTLGALAPRGAVRATASDALVRDWTERPRAIEFHASADATDLSLRPLKPLLPGASNMLAPVIADGRLLGGLSVGHRARREYAAGELRLIERLALHAAIAVAAADLREEVRGLSLTDAATGLANRRRLDLFLDKEFAAARRGRRLSLLRLDIDGLADRDGFGAAAGGEALTALTAVLRAQTRAMNLAARIGANAFAIVLSDADRRAAFTHARRIATAIRNDATLASAGLRASFGLATFNTRLRSPGDLVDAAEQDLVSRTADPGARLSI